jgi:very-short-patch-repair endonuclease
MHRRTRLATVSALSARQLGLITRRQLVECGLGRGAVESWIDRGVLTRKERGVYEVGRPAEDRLADHLAAVLSLPCPGWLRGRSAGAVWGVLPGPAPTVPQVCVVGGGARSRPGLDVLRLQRLDTGDCTVRGPFPVTSLARTVVDLGAELVIDDLERAFAEAVAVRGLDLRSVGYAMERRGRFRGVANLRRLLALADGPQRTRSELERELRRLVRESGLAAPRMNVRIGPYEVDALWPEERVVGEADGFGFHRSRQSFEADRRRDAELQGRGFVVTRMTWRQMTDDRVATAARLGAILAVRRIEQEARW